MAAVVLGGPRSIANSCRKADLLNEQQPANRTAFFTRFAEGKAARQTGRLGTRLRKYCATMVVGVDALRDVLGIGDGVAAANVYVLDPCGGTGASRGGYAQDL